MKVGGKFGGTNICGPRFSIFEYGIYNFIYNSKFFYEKSNET